MSFSLNKLTEGIRDRHVGQQNKRLVEKWSRTGLLRGMDDVNRENMATMLENQAAQVLRESNTMGSDAVGGFTNIAFPIVRRVFGGLIANELVSIQPMSLPSGLLFYLDYTYGSDNGHYKTGESIYGDPKGKNIQSGAAATGGQYDLAGTGFSRPHVTGVLNDGDTVTAGAKLLTSNNDHLKLINHDPQLIDLVNGGEDFQFFFVAATDISPSLDKTALSDIAIMSSLSGLNQADAATAVATLTEAVDDSIQSGTAQNVRRVTKLGTGTTESTFAEDSVSGTIVCLLVKITGETALADPAANVVDGNNITDLASFATSFVKADDVSFADGQAEGAPAFEYLQNHTGGVNPSDIPEIDIKIESIPVTAQTRKLRARWSPELAQDLNAYHSMDAEVELTQILSEQIALEIDREILSDLLNGAQGANFFWSRSPGKFVNKRTGAAIARTSTLQPGPAFTGTVREWYETLTETVIDVANEIHRKTLRGSANFIVVSPDVATVLEASVLYRPSYSIDGDGQVGAPFTMGAEKMGTLSNRFTVYKDPYFPRNKILVGYKGGSYLETGFVYAPYVPLIVTPTIFQPDDFTPRKGVMTRYGKKMVRADFYGTVTCLDMNII